MANLDAPIRNRIYDSIIDTIGNTPLVRIPRLAEEAGAKADIVLKLEFFNPLSSVKDRIALSMIEQAEADGSITKDTLLVEPTSGNTGIALAFIAAAKGYKILLTMPESMSVERRKMLKLLGAQLELTEAAGGMKGAIAKAEEIVAKNGNAVMLQQFINKSNPKIHRETTAEEIWADTAGKVGAFMAGVGTGGTVTGTGSRLKEHNPEIKIFAVEPTDSPVLAGGKAGPHKIQGIGAGFVPDVYQADIVDEVVAVTNDEAFDMARKIAALEGIPVGISSGATIAAGLKVAARDDMAGKLLVVVIASTAERYLSTPLFDGLD